MNLYAAISKRVSVRTYEHKKIDTQDIKKIKSILSSCQSMTGPFGHSFELNYSENNSPDTNGKKIGTYGLLKNVPAYIGGISQNNSASIIDYGYIFEHVILSLTAQNFGTCWLGGTFKRDHYKKDLEDNQIIPAISPVGYLASNRSIMEKLLRRAAKSDNRLSFDHLFFDQNFNPLSKDSKNVLIDCLEMVRKGPSASNKQPWRMIIDEKKHIYHLYIKRTPNYASMIKYDMQALDIGIALAHFEISLKHHYIKFEREILDQYPKKDDFEYIISIKKQS